MHTKLFMVYFITQTCCQKQNCSQLYRSIKLHDFKIIKNSGQNKPNYVKSKYIMHKHLKEEELARYTTAFWHKYSLSHAMKAFVLALCFNQKWILASNTDCNSNKEVTPYGHINTEKENSMVMSLWIHPQPDTALSTYLHNEPNIPYYHRVMYKN